MANYELGEYLRKRYKKLLGNGQYLSDKAYVLSTVNAKNCVWNLSFNASNDLKFVSNSKNSDRVIQSAQCTLASLFPPSDNQIWNPIGLNPIPVHTIPENQDYTLGVRKSCDRFEYEMSHYINSTAYTDLFVEHRKLIKYLEKHSGKKIKSLIDIGLLYDTLSIEMARGYRYVQFK